MRIFVTQLNWGVPLIFSPGATKFFGWQNRWLYTIGTVYSKLYAILYRIRNHEQWKRTSVTEFFFFFQNFTMEQGHNSGILPITVVI